MGRGNLPDIFRAASDLWESKISSPASIHINFGWASAGDYGACFYGGNTSTVLFEQSYDSFFLDSSPKDNQEWDSYRETFNLCNLINDSRAFYNIDQFRISGGVQTLDLFSVALHEIGHALGFSVSNPSFQENARDGYFDLDNGSRLLLSWNIYGAVAHVDWGKI